MLKQRTTSTRTPPSSSTSIVSYNACHATIEKKAGKTSSSALRYWRQSSCLSNACDYITHVTMAKAVACVRAAVELIASRLSVRKVTLEILEISGSSSLCSPSTKQEAKLANDILGAAKQLRCLRILMLHLVRNSDGVLCNQWQLICEDTSMAVQKPTVPANIRARLATVSPYKRSLGSLAGLPSPARYA